MTEAEELELLELEEEEAALMAKPAQAGPKHKDPGILNTIASGLSEGGLKYWSDELIGKGMDLFGPEGVKAPGVAPGKSSGTIMRDNVRDLQHASDEHHPWIGTAAKIAGDVGTDFLLSKAGIPVTSLPYQLASGALSGAGASESETPGGVAVDAGIGAGITGIAHGIGKYAVGPALSAVGRKLGPKLTEFAGNRALRAVGATAKDIKGKPAERISEIGQQLLETGTGAEGKPVVSAFASKDKMLQRAGEGLKEHGQEIGRVLGVADSAAAGSASKAFNWTPVLERLGNEFQKLDEVARGSVGPVKKQILSIAEAAKNGGGYGHANRIKTSIQESINWRVEPKAVTRLAKAVQGILDDEVERQLASKVGGELAEQFKAAKGVYGAMKTAHEPLEAAAQSAAMGKGSGPGMMSTLMSAGGLASFGLPGAIAGPIVSAGRGLLKAHGAQAVAAKGIADSSLLKFIIKNSPNILGELAAPLTRAMMDGDERTLAIHDFVLSQQDPNYREQRKAAQEKLNEQSGVVE